MNPGWPRVQPVGDRAVTVELGPSLDEETVGRVRALDDRLRERGVPGILETVPAYASLLVLYDPDRLAFAEIKSLLLELGCYLRAATHTHRLVEIPTLYDGQDLDDVAGACGLHRGDVIELHSSVEYRVLMLGFSPGFGYMGFVDERLRVPRRKTPRTRVPAGSVAVAGAQTGVYPRALPGGWNLLGRSSLTLFDPGSRDPSVLAPGDRVRFVSVASLQAPEPVRRSSLSTGRGVRVLDPGLLTTVQDAGRAGLRRLAVPLAGYADRGAAEDANRCVGNRPGSPVIELCGPGMRLAFDKASLIAITGARVTATLQRGDQVSGPMSVPMNVSVRVRPTNVLTIEGLAGGARGYVAIAGLDAPRVLGSASTDLGSGFLRPLENGDELTVSVFDSERALRDPIVPTRHSDVVRVILGPQADHFDPSVIETFLRRSWQVGLDTDRVGARLDGERLTHCGPREIVSDGMVPGCIQVPPDGRPIVMLSDCPTTGGYPKIACVVSQDLPVIAQAIPGRTEIRFVSVEIEKL